MKNLFAALFFTIALVSCRSTNENTRSIIHYIPKEAPLIIKVDELSLLRSEFKNNNFIKKFENTSFYNHLKRFFNATNYLRPQR